MNIVVSCPDTNGTLLISITTSLTKPVYNQSLNKSHFHIFDKAITNLSSFQIANISNL